MRILFDTNVLIASLVSHGFCQELLEHSFIEHDLITSDFILSELKDKLVKKFKFSEEIAAEAIDLFGSRMKVVTPARLDSPVCRDADDDNVLSAAVAGLCDFIVTGDKDLLEIKEYQGIRIVGPRAFMELEF